MQLRTGIVSCQTPANLPVLIPVPPPMLPAMLCCAGREADASMQLRTFLSMLAPVAAREPSVFVEAVRATCTLSEGPSGMLAGRRALISLKKKVSRCGGRAGGQVRGREGGREGRVGVIEHEGSLWWGGIGRVYVGDGVCAAA
jgi:hypothetical protein